jgi:hypothetical protein
MTDKDQKRRYTNIPLGTKDRVRQIEKLVNQILFVSDVSGQQIPHEHVGKRMFPVKHIIHGLLVNFHHGAIVHCGCGAQAQSLSCKATLPEKIPTV